MVISAWGVADEGRPLQRVVVCPPGPAYFDVTDLSAHNIAAPADRALAEAQHAELRHALSAAGADVITLDALPGHPNSVFTQDAALVTPAGFIRLRMGLPTRASESTWMAVALRTLGVPEVGRIEPPGTVEGGDVILAGEVAFVGRSGRTNAEGARQLRALLTQQGYEVRVTDVPERALHIGGAMSVVGPGRVLACAGALPLALFQGFEAISVPPADFISGNVITLGDESVLVEQRNVAAAAALESAGFHVHRLDLSEFVKGSGGPSCLILPLARE